MKYTISVKKPAGIVGRAGTLAANAIAPLVGLPNVEVDALTETDEQATLSYESAKDVTDEVSKALAAAHLETREGT